MGELVKRGEIWVIDLNPAFGKEIHKKRPALIISNNLLNRSTPFVVVIPITSIVPTILSEEMVPLGKVSGLEKESVLLPLFIRNIDKNRLIKNISRLSKEKLTEVEDTLKLVLGMEEN